MRRRTSLSRNASRALVEHIQLAHPHELWALLRSNHAPRVHEYRRGSATWCCPAGVVRQLFAVAQLTDYSADKPCKLDQSLFGGQLAPHEPTDC